MTIEDQILGVRHVAAKMRVDGASYADIIEMAYRAGVTDQQKDDNRVRLTNLSHAQWELLRAAERWRDEYEGHDLNDNALIAAVDRLRAAKA